MIFLTVGTQLPFTRLTGAANRIAGENGLKVFAQTAEPDSNYPHLEHQAFLNPSEYETTLSKARILVGHAGIGTILTAKKYQLPVILFPRRAELGEHRNDHQLATVTQVKNHTGVFVAHTDQELCELLQRKDLPHAREEDNKSHHRLKNFLNDYVTELP